MGWATCIMNLEAGKMELIPPEKRPDVDDPRYGSEVHIVPVVDVGEYHSWGGHEFEESCYCHPEVRKQVYGRTLIVHKDTVN